MSTEEIILEILQNSEEKGVRLKVLEKVLKLMHENPKLSRVEAYEKAYGFFVN